MRNVLLCTILGCGFLGGCQSFPPLQTQMSNYDVAKMARIERAAAMSGVTVIWVNPPLLQGEKVAAVTR